MNTVVSQAMATGLPVIVTNHSGLPEQVVDGRNGFVVPEGDVEALAEKINTLMERPDLWAPFGQFGRAHALRHYDAGPLTQQQVECYRELANRSANRQPAPASDSTIPAPLRQLAMPMNQEHPDGQSEQTAVWQQVRAASAAGDPLFSNLVFTHTYPVLAQYVPADVRTLLDAGAGTGRHGLKLALERPDCAITLADIAEESLSLMRQHKDRLGLGNVRVMSGDICRLPFHSDSFDVVLSVGVVQYVSDPGSAVQEMARVLRTGGRLILAVVNYWNWHTLYKWFCRWAGRRYEYGGEKSYRASELRTLCSVAKLRVVAEDGYYSAYSVCRLQRYCRLWGWLGRTLNCITKWLDGLSGRFFSRHFGYERVIVAEKS